MLPIQLLNNRWPVSLVGLWVCLFFLGGFTLADPPEWRTALFRPTVPDTWFSQKTHPQQRRDLPLNSAASCAATACHGGPRSGVEGLGAVRGSEYPIWLTSDPHARSWRTLCSDQSVAILKRLEILKDDRVVDQAGFDNCLACHNSTHHFQESRTSERITEGVGCSSCHGPDQLWRAAHTERDWSRDTALASGFAPTKNLLARARLCASCHVGDRDRDMNHDIIAAGHPALHYEFTTYQRRQPKHWRSGATPHEDNEAYAWLAGQLAALDAFLTLLESRTRAHPMPTSPAPSRQALAAVSATNPSPAGEPIHNKGHEENTWPELATFDCSSCHQRLTHETYQAPPRTRPGIALSQWHRFGVQQFLEWRCQQSIAQPIDRELLDALKELEGTIKDPSVDAAIARESSQRTRHVLDRWIISLDGQRSLDGFDAAQLHSLVAMAGIDRAANGSWESAAQYYLASVAAKSEWSQTSRRGTVLETSRHLREALQFRTNTVTPQNRFRDGEAASLGQQSLKSHWQSLQKTLSLDHAEGTR